VSALTVAAGSQAVSGFILASPAALLWPAHPPTPRAWGAVAVLAVVCTALAYVLFFRLIARIGAARTVTVTFMIPVFGVLWGALFLGELVTLRMLLGGTVILIGTALTTGLLRSRKRIKAAVPAAAASRMESAAPHPIVNLNKEPYV
jgi:drug/metabolite transporter (DMT)-like permease